MNQRTETKQDGTGKIITEQKYNPLAAAEMMKEDNYNQIDGVLNNMSKPSFDDRMKDAKSKANAYNNRKIERHKKTRHSNKSDRHKKERD